MDYDKIKVRLVKLTYILLLSGVVFAAVKFLPTLILPFLAAVAIAELVRKPVDFLSTKSGISRRVCSFSVVTLALAVLLGLGWCIVYQLYAAAQGAIEALPSLVPQINAALAWVQELIGKISGEIPLQLTDIFQNAPSEMIQTVLTKLTGALTSAASGFPSFILTLVVSIIAAYIVSADYYKLKQFLSRSVKSKTWDKLSQARRIVVVKLARLARGYGVLMLITFAEVFAALLILGFDNALVMAVITAAVDVLPIFGAGTVLVPWAVLELLQADFYQGLGLAVAYVAISIVRNFIEPRVIGAQIKLSPLIMLAAMYLGFKLFGVAGLLLAPFVASIVREMVVENVL